MLSALSALAQQAGTIDRTFSCAVSNTGMGAVYRVALQSDGKVLIGGSFNTVNGQPYAGIARLLEDGSLDPTFEVGSGFDGVVRDIVIQPNGKIIVVGAFTHYNGRATKLIARLRSNGKLDRAYSKAGGSRQTLIAVKLLPKGKIVALGNGPQGVIRLTATGVPDRTFKSSPFPSSDADCMAIDSTGRILLGGSFLDNWNLTCVARFTKNGERDATFSCPIDRSRIYGIVPLPDQRTLVYGDFSSETHSNYNFIARLKEDGSIDPTFSTVTHPHLGIIQCAALDLDNNILIGGGYPRVARMRYDGQYDFGFLKALEPPWGPHCLAVDSKNRIWLGGGNAISFIPNTNGTPIQGVARMHSGVSFREWRQSAFDLRQLTNASLSGSGVDPDQDGLNNALEYGSGTKPLEKDFTKPVVGVRKVLQSGKTNFYLTTTFKTDRRAADLVYTVDASTNLLNWTNVATAYGGAPFARLRVFSQTTNDIRQVTVGHAIPNDGTNSRFLRVNATFR